MSQNHHMFSPSHSSFTQHRVLQYQDGDWRVPGGDARQVGIVQSDGQRCRMFKSASPHAVGVLKCLL